MYKIYDSIHRFIQVEEHENALIDSRPFQRLHYIHQLGLTFLVYPGGSHKRFEHSLGVMEIASRIYDQITDASKLEQIPKKGSFAHYYWRKILRLAALCHDLGHLPFSHVAEKVLLGKGGHEKWSCRIIKSAYLKPIWDSLQKECVDTNFPCDVEEDIIKVSIGEANQEEMITFTPWIKVLSEIITGDFFGADRIDYLLRDAQYTGLVYGLFDYHQLIEMLRIIPVGDHLELGIEENGIESCESLLISRHFMHKRIYQYASVKIYSFHLARFMGAVYGSHMQNISVDEYIQLTDNEVLTEVNKAARDPSHVGYEDAKAIYYRENRFKALSAPKLSVQKLLLLKKQCSISDHAIGVEMHPEAQKSDLSFPVLMKDGTIISSNKVAEISIPSNNKDWVFIAPKHEGELKQLL